MKDFRQQLMGKTIGDVGPIFRKSYKPILIDEEKEYKIVQVSHDEVPFESFTKTSTMKDGIGNVTEMGPGDSLCSVKAIVRGVEREFKNVKILDYRIKSKHDRVMITEHLSILDGNIEMVATKERVLRGDFNFFNFGWENSKWRRVITVDIYTGDFISHRQEKVRQ